MKDFSNLAAYELIKTEELPDLQGTGYYFRHKKSGARVAWVQNADDNKVFCIGFRTPPTDSTGVAHIIEHTVLCGSEHFPAKDPFIELAKGSLNTFLNAMTFSDKTIYPIASCNTQDFKNLMHVYLDAVFYPNIYKREEIFKQEGWHYELESEDADLIYNGIVYSEMKGAFSSPEQVLSRTSMNALFPDTSYGVESGGDPDDIPSLTYENYLDFHRRYYHPVNSYIYLYGDLDIEERLDWMDREYLSKFEKIELDSTLKLQKEFGGFREVTKYYSVEEEKADGSGVFYSYNVLAGKPLDLMEGTALDVLDQILFSTPGAPVKQALLDAGIGEDYISYFESSVLQPFFLISAKNAKAGQKEKFVEVLRGAFEKCVKEGLKESAVRAAINAQEFRYKEADFGRFPKGLLYGINALGSWLYDEDKPFDYLQGNVVYAELKKKIGTRYFEDLIEKYFLNSSHGAIVQLLPKAGLNAEKDAALKQKLADYKNSLSDAERKALVEATKNLKAYQSEPSTKEELEAIPMLSISDIEKKAKPYKNEKFLDGRAEALWHNIYTNGISYIRLLFDAKGMEASEISYCGLLRDILSQVATKKHGYKELAEEINIYTGGFAAEAFSFSTKENYRAFEPRVGVSMKVLTENTDKAIGFLKEILCESEFTDRKRLHELLLMFKSRQEMWLMQSGNTAALARLSSYGTENGAFDDAVWGIGYYEFVKGLLADYESKAAEIAVKLEKTAKTLFANANLTISLTAAEDGRKAFETEIPALLSALYPDNGSKNLHMVPVKKNEGFKTPGQVQYVVRGGNYKDAGVAYHGSYQVLQNMLSYGYLWNEIRVKGGAYGGGLVVHKGTTGNVAAYSYRDPNLAETNKVYEGLPDYVEHFDCDEREMTKNILGTMSNVDFPLTPKAEGSRSFMGYLTGWTDEDVQKERDEILATTPEDIRKTKPLMEALLASGCICTVGSAAKVEECRDLFDEVKTLI